MVGRQSLGPQSKSKFLDFEKNEFSIQTSAFKIQNFPVLMPKKMPKTPFGGYF